MLAVAATPGVAERVLGADEPEPIKVLAQVKARPYFVSQAIELRIAAEGRSERPEVIPPTIPGADVALIDSLLIPVAASGIGASTTERNLFVTRFRLIAHRAGLLRIPSVRVRLGSQKGASPPLSVEVRSLPVLNRPAEFLGGVGSFELRADATQRSIRVGQDLLYTIEVTGPAARGMTESPTLTRSRQVPLGLELEPLPAEARDSPPSRRFRFRIRATRAGTASLPPVAVAGFDPETQQYVTRVTPSIPIRVIDQPRFDPASLEYSAPPRAIPQPAPRSDTGFGAAVAVLGGFFGLSIVVSVMAAVQNRWKSDPRRQLLRRARLLDARSSAGDAARLITHSLAEFLERVGGHPLGALTPLEARGAIARATHDDSLADRAAQLITACDRARYSEREDDTTALVAAARKLFNADFRGRENNQTSDGCHGQR
jgi:hypothetical protein